MIMGMVNLIFVTVSILFVDKVGRRKLMIFGPAGMGVFMFCISIAYFTGNFTGMLPLLLMTPRPSRSCPRATTVMPPRPTPSLSPT